MTRNWTDRVDRVAVLTGAGISTDSGIPDYRGPQGVWTRDPALADAFTYASFMADAAVRATFWRTYLGHSAWSARPNAAHRALAELERAGPAVRILTQNVDGLHQRAGSTARKVLELHGSMHEVVCTGCGTRTPTRATLDRVAAGDADPRCPACGGVLKPVASLCAVAVNGGTALVIVNRDPTPYDDLATEVIREPIGVAVPRLCADLAAAARSSAA